MGDGIIYNEEWDKTAEVKKSGREENEIEQGGVEEIETGMGEVDQSEGEESDHFEDCEQKQKITPIFPLIVTISTYEHPPTTAFNLLYTP